MSEAVFRRGLTVTDTVESNLGTAGQQRIATDGRVYRLVKAGASVANLGLVVLDSVSASVGNIVEPPAAFASGKAAYGANQAGTSVAAAGYFWCMVHGTASVRSADIGSDVSMNSHAMCILNSDGRIAQNLGVATTVIPNTVIGQFIQSVSRASDATVTAPVFVVGQAW